METSISSPLPSSYSLRLTWIILILVGFAFVAYHLPWHTHKVAAFSNNGFDLAEWMSLHPAIRNTEIESTPLLTVWFLRVIVLLMALVVVLYAAKLRDERWRWIWRLIAVFMVLRLNPPIDFYKNLGLSLEGRTPENMLVLGWIANGADANNAMLGNLMVSGLVMIVGLTLASRWLKYGAFPLTLIACGYAIYAAERGYDGANEALETFQLNLEVGIGYTLFRLAMVAIALLSALEFLLGCRQWYKTWQSAPMSHPEPHKVVPPSLA